MLVARVAPKPFFFFTIEAEGINIWHFLHYIRSMIIDVEPSTTCKTTCVWGERPLRQVASILLGCNMTSQSYTVYRYVGRRSSLAKPYLSQNHLSSQILAPLFDLEFNSDLDKYTIGSFEKQIRKKIIKLDIEKKTVQVKM